MKKWGIRVLALIHVLTRIYISYCLVIALLLFPPFLKGVEYTAIAMKPHGLVPWQWPLRIDAAWEVVVDGQTSLQLYTPAEVAHLQDVHRVLFWLFAWAFPLTVVCLVSYVDVKNRVSLRVWIRQAVWWLSGCSLFMIIFFPLFFEVFHQLFFPQGNYSFPGDSALILTFPLIFWILEFVLLQVLVTLFLLFQAQHAEKRKL